MMVYRFKVSLPNIKGFNRTYEITPHNTLYQFHKQMMADMEFPRDQIVLFKAFDAEGNLVARYATFDLGSGSIDTITIEHILKEGITSFVYFYDTTNKKSVIVTFDGQAEDHYGLDPVTVPTLVESKGPIPQAFLNGYVAFEDLPAEKRRISENDDPDDFDDEDDDDGDDEDSDEDFKETYDENEK